jgi:molybdopterin-guanine dinucleotide biosynthesis protein A
MSSDGNDNERNVLPVVLVGGASARFGRDKLLEPMGGGGLLVDRPIRALREATGAAVMLVGACDALVAARADGVIEDPYPGVGPIGGVLASIEYAHGDVVVLAGDLPGIDADSVRLLLAAAAGNPEAWAVVARTDRVQPAIGVYRVACVDSLQAAMASGRRSLGRAVPEERRVEVEIPAGAARNVNRVEDL